MSKDETYRISFDREKVKTPFVGATGVTATTQRASEPSGAIDIDEINGGEVIYNSSQKLVENIDSLGQKLGAMSANKNAQVVEYQSTTPPFQTDELFAWGKNLLLEEDEQVVSKEGEKDNFCRSCGRRYTDQDNFCGGCGFKRG